MISQKKQLFMMPILLMIFFFVLGIEWIYSLIMVGSAMLGGILGYFGKFGLWGASWKTQFTASKWLLVIWAGLLLFIWIPNVTNLPLWRQILATLLIFLIGGFECINSYIGYKKEQRERIEPEERNRKSSQNV